MALEADTHTNLIEDTHSASPEHTSSVPQMRQQSLMSPRKRPIWVSTLPDEPPSYNGSPVRV